MSKYAPSREDGKKPYVITTSQWGKSYDRIEWADDLREAKAQHGWTRMLHTSISVRRATPEDMEKSA